MRVVLDGLEDRALGLAQREVRRGGRLGQRRADRADHEVAGLLAQREARALARAAHGTARRAAERRQMLGVELANRESVTSWREFVLGLRERGLHGVEFVVSDDHVGLRKAALEILPEASWQRCYVHFLRNALDHLPRKHADDCLLELRWLYDLHGLAGAK